MAAVELARLLETGSIFKSSYHESPDYSFYSYAVNGDLLLTVIFGAETKPGMVWFYTKKVAIELADEFVENNTTVEVAAGSMEGLSAMVDTIRDVVA